MQLKSKIKKIPYIESFYRNAQYVYYKHIVGEVPQAKRIFKKTFGYDLNLNNPKTFTEKINYLKLYYASEENAVLAGDKVGLHEFLKKKNVIDLTVPMLNVVNSVKKIKWDRLPNQFVIKKSNASGFNLIVENRKKLCIEDLKEILVSWEKQVYGLTTAEPHYRKMPSRFIIEEYLPNIDRDWKIFFCNGEPCMVEAYLWDEQEKMIGHRKTVYITTDLQGKVLQIDADEELLTESNSEYEALRYIDLPVQFDQMIEYGRILAAEFPFVRVDFFISDDRLFLGELTFTPAAGLDNYSEEIERWLGKKIRLPHEKK